MKGNRKGKAEGSGIVFIVAGAALIIFISLLDGFVFSFTNATRHVISDLTIDSKVHAYIAGIILSLYGIVKYPATKVAGVRLIT